MKKQLAVVLCIVLLAFSVTACGSSEATVVDDNSAKTQNVKTIVVQTGDINKNLTFNGSLTAINTVPLVSKVPGEILDVLVTVGDSVEKDQLIYTMDKKDVARSVENARLAYEAASLQVSSLSDQHELAVKNFERVSALYNGENGQAIPQAEYEQAEKAASSASVDAAKSQVAQTKLALDQAQDQYSDADLKTSISGIVTMINLEPGQTVGAGQHIADIVNMDEVYVDIQVSENIVNALTAGMTMDAEIPAIGEETLSGVIEWVSPAADSTTKLFPVRVTFDNPSHILKPGMFVKINLMVSEAKGTIIIPSDTVLQRAERKIVYVDNNGVAEEKTVITGFDNGDNVVILDGLSEGDKLIVEGQQFLESGTPLIINGGE